MTHIIQVQTWARVRILLAKVTKTLVSHRSEVMPPKIENTYIVSFHVAEKTGLLEDISTLPAHQGTVLYLNVSMPVKNTIISQ